MLDFPVDARKRTLAHAGDRDTLKDTGKMNDESYLQPSRKAQIIVLVVLILMALIVASLEPVLKHVTPGKSATLEELEGGARLLAILGLVTFSVACVVALTGAGYFARLGYRAMKLGSFPPPGTIVVVRTRIRTGKQVLLSGWLSILFGVLMIAPAVILGYLTWLFAGIL